MKRELSYNWVSSIPPKWFELVHRERTRKSRQREVKSISPAKLLPPAAKSQREVIKPGPLSFLSIGGKKSTSMTNLKVQTPYIVNQYSIPRRLACPERKVQNGAMVLPSVTQDRFFKRFDQKPQPFLPAPSRKGLAGFKLT